jgi:hypothetical protein
VRYKTVDEIFQFDNLTYKHSDTGIFTDGILHLFDDNLIDSRVSTINERPFIGFGYSEALVTDIDNHDGKLIYLQVEEMDHEINIKLIKIDEKEIDMVLPIYSHYRFGLILFILLLGFIPITNYDEYRK